MLIRGILLNKFTLKLMSLCIAGILGGNFHDPARVKNQKESLIKEKRIAIMFLDNNN